MSNIPILSDPTYRIESEIGSGGGGVVYKAWHTRLQKYVVIKELRYVSQSDIITQRNEVEALKNVKSAYLPQVYDFLTEGDRSYSVIEFIEGVSLDKLLERGQRFPQAQAVKWYAQLTSALEAIHKQNICHRDVKPANIMLTPSGDVCLIDFNAALVGGNDVRLVSRSLGYASPEQYEIYERYRNTYSAPMHLGGSSVNINPAVQMNASERTEYVPDDSTEFLDSDNTEILSGNSQHSPAAVANYYGQGTEAMAPSPAGNIDWRRSDIYSLGATMYHLLTGVRPPEQAVHIVPISKYNCFSEGMVYVIEQSMQLNPYERFASVTALHDAIRNIHKHDKRWKAARSKRTAAAIILPIIFTLFAVTALYGRSIMAQEKEEQYYAVIYEIENGDSPQSAFDTALDMFWDRIDPYRAMAMRLWDDGNIEACRDFIEQNLGNVAKFQSDDNAARAFGDIYFILGNCYYYGVGEPDYNLAAGNFEIAVRFVTDSPVYYRDYAIALARTGRTDEAQRILRQAERLDLEADSLNLSNGEIAYANGDYTSAVESFSKVIDLSGDEYLRYRAYRTTDEIYKLLGQPEQSVALLRNALNRIPLSRVPEMTERLADAYIKCGDYENAVILFEQLLDSGAAHFHLFEGLAIMLQELGEFGSAVSVLERMGDLFPNDYRVPMRLAFLEADRQMGIVNEERDYVMVGVYYNNAVALYNNNVRPGEADAQMQQLELLVEQLVAHGWLS